MSIERTDRATRVALARWQLIAQAADERLSAAERGLLLSQTAAQVHRDVDSRPRRYSARTLYRWLEAWQAYGFDGLKPSRRRDAGTHRIDATVLALAAALRKEAPARSAPQIADIILRTRGTVVHPRTLQRYFAANGLDRARLEGRHRAYGRFEAAACAVPVDSRRLGHPRLWRSWAGGMRSWPRSSMTTPGCCLTAPFMPM
jgi:putative transposase